MYLDAKVKGGGVVAIALVTAWGILLLTSDANAATQPYGVNLIVNGTAEQGPSSSTGAPVASIPGWTISGSGHPTVVPYGAPGGFPTSSDPGPPDRANQFFAGGNNGNSILFQNLSVSGNAAEIDAGGVTCDLSAWLGGFATDDDRPNVDLIFLDGNGATLLSQTVLFGPIATDRNNATGLLFKVADGFSVPVNTRSITIQLTFFRIAGAYNDAYADNVSFSLRRPMVVTTTADDGTGSLRAAIPVANAITFLIPGGWPQKIELLTPLPLITSSLYLAGPGSQLLTIEKAPAAAAFTAPSFTFLGVSTFAAYVQFRGVTISKGSAGAVTNVNCRAEFDDCTLSNNGDINAATAGALKNTGGIQLVNCLVTGNESARTAIDNTQDGRLDIFRSTISNNRGDQGAAVANTAQGYVSFSASTVMNNSEANTSGGPYLGILYNGDASEIDLFNSTLSANSNPSSSVIYSTCRIRLLSCTLVGDALYAGNGATATSLFNNTIFKATTARGNISLTNGATVSSSGYNLSSDAAGAFLIQPTDQNSTDPLLGPLQNNGGPTWTHALLAGSPAIDKGNSSFATDQRSALRPYDDPASPNGSGNKSDIGAFEFGDAFLVIKAVAKSGSNIAVTFTVLPANTYELQRATTLINPPWTTVGNLTTSGSGTGQITHTGGVSGSVGFYRVILP